MAHMIRIPGNLGVHINVDHIVHICEQDQKSPHGGDKPRPYTSIKMTNNNSWTIPGHVASNLAAAINAKATRFTPEDDE